MIQKAFVDESMGITQIKERFINGRTYVLLVLADLR